MEIVDYSSAYLAGARPNRSPTRAKPIVVDEHASFVEIGTVTYSRAWSFASQSLAHAGKPKRQLRAEK